MIRGLLAVTAVVALALTGGLIAGRAWTGPSRLPHLAARAPAATPATPRRDAPGGLAGCDGAPGFDAAAAQNGQSLAAATWQVFGRAETGWAAYAPLVAHEIGAACAPDTTGFARSLATWQGGHGLPAAGVMDAATLQALNQVWLARRPFVAATLHGACPAPPPPDRLAAAQVAEGYSGKAVQLRDTALVAWRQMVAAARREAPDVAADPRLLTIFSGYRDPETDAARCAQGGDCGTVAKANCSAHRTGLAVDLYLGAAPGFPPDSSADPNRVFLAQTAAYRWLVANAARFGFVPYPFEPWHWEWTGEAP